MRMGLKHLWRSRRGGWATLEYLVVAAAVIAAILAVKGDFESKTEELLRNAVNDLPAFPGP